MRELAAVIISFCCVPLLSKRNIPIGIAICICAVLMSIIGGLGINGFFDVILSTITDINKIEQYIIVAEIGVLGVLLKEYDFIDKIIDYLSKVVNNRRIILMFIPALVGLLVVPGGAIISAPFVDRIGEDAKITKTNRAIINLIYRHISMHIMPYSTGLLVIALIVPQVSINKVIGLNLIFVIIYCLIGYFLYLRKVENEKSDLKEPLLPNLLQLIKYTSPIYFAVILNILFKIPFHIGLLSNFIIVYLLNPTKSFFKDIKKAFNFKILLTIIGVYLIQENMTRMEYLNKMLVQAFSNPDTTIIGIIATSLFFGITTGFQPAALGAILPILAMLPMSNNRLLLFCHFAFVWSFMGYFFSPLHLCQLFTCEYLGVSTSDLYKSYWKFLLLLIAALMIGYFVLIPFF
jgi:hypothetical protein